jgi:hypothetical protein
MERHYFGLSTLLASVALLIWSIGETFAYPQGPNVSTGINPIVTISCNNHSDYPNNANQYVVPSGYDYIITDILTGWGIGSHTYVYVNGSALFGDYRYGTNVGGFPNLKTGLKVNSSHTVSCTSPGKAVISGYLAHQ